MPTATILAREPRDPIEAVSPALDRSVDSIAPHLEDAAHFPGGHAEALAKPRTEAEVAGLIVAASQVLAIGAQSSVTGGATPNGGLILSTERLTRFEQTDGGAVRCGAGIALATLQKLLSEHARWYPPVPTFTGAFVGGVIATNAAGAATYKYGTTRAWIEGLTVVLACGHVLDLVRGDVLANPVSGWRLECSHGTRVFKPGTYQMPAVPKCSAGYFAAPEMDLIDLFIGAEGTLGVITEATIRVLPTPPAVAIALVPVGSESAALALVHDLREASHRTWQERDARGIDVAAIEYLDRRCLQVLREDGADRRSEVTLPPDTELVLLIQVELAAGTSVERAYEEIAASLDPNPPDTALVRLCRMLDHHQLFEHAELAMPGDVRRAEQLLAFREGVPTGVNRRVGDAKRDIDPRIEKSAGDMIVPFDQFGDMMAIYRDGYHRRGLDFAIWGHISDGNVHPNVIPRSYADVVAGKEAMLEFGREVARLGGCPLAEHGVGRSAIKQALLRQLYGERGIGEMRAIKQVLDPDWKLAPGNLFDRD
jgi:D-lactate dehydrogenase (cytochrome)